MVVAAFISIGQPVTAQPSPTEQLRVRPAPGSPTDSGGSYFIIPSKAGRVLRQSLEISNLDDQAIELRVSAVDAVTASRGGVAYELADRPVDDEGSWIEIDKERLRVASRGTAQVPFRVSVPEDAESGVHLAGLSVELVEKDQPKATPTSGGAVVDFRSRFVVAVQVNVPGDTTPQLVVTGVEPVVRTGGVTLEVLIENVGFGLTEGEGVLELPDEGFEEPLPLGKVVPGTSIRYPVTWLRDPAEGEYTARVSLNYSEDDPELLTGRASWEGTFVIGQAAVQELDRLQGSEGFNWLLLIPVLLALLLVAAFLLRRRRGRPAPAAATPAAPIPTAAAPAQSAAPKPGYTGGYTGSASGTFGGTSQAPKPNPQSQPGPGGAPPPPPPPPPKQGP